VIRSVHAAERRARGNAVSVARRRATARDSNEESYRKRADEPLPFCCSYSKGSIDHCRPSARTRPCSSTTRKLGHFHHRVRRS
jgi:hypothetical protein